MEVSFGARLICPTKKLIKETDSERFKCAVNENIALLEQVFKTKAVQYYSGDDVYTFSRRQKGKQSKFYLSVLDSLSKKTELFLYGGDKDFSPCVNSFYEALMSYLCEKHAVPIPWAFKSWLEVFCNFVERQKALAKVSLFLKKPDYVRVLPPPKPIAQLQSDSVVKQVEKQRKLSWDEVLELPVEQAEHELFGFSLIGGKKKFRDFLRDGK